MIVIFDNGRSYSDHTLHFVEVPEGVIDNLNLALTPTTYREKGRCADITWRQGQSSTLDDFITDVFEFEDMEDQPDHTVVFLAGYAPELIRECAIKELVRRGIALAGGDE